LVRDIEELANGECDVEEWGCLGRCGKGPNVELAFSSGEKRIVEGVVDWKNTLALVRDEAECEVPSKVKKLCKMKYEIRRAEDPAKRNEKLQKAFDFLGGEDTTAAAAEPMLLGSLLILRSKALLKDQLADALKDAQKAAELAPTWAQSQLALAAALEASGRAGDGAKALKAALDIGKGINKASVKRALTRLERKAKEEPVAPVAAEATGAGTSPAAAASPKKKPTAKKASAPKDKAKKDPKVDSKDKKLAKAAEPVAPAPVEEEILPDFLEWKIDSVRILNHDCISILLKSGDMKSIARQPDAGNAWHIDILKEGEMGNDLKRSYTPVSSAQEYKEGTLDLMIKVYPKGKMTPYLAGLRPGSGVLVSAPVRTLDPAEYPGLVMIAGGSAVTIAIQMCQAVLSHHSGGVAVHLALCNKTAADVLYQDVFEGMLEKFPSFHVTHCISSGSVPVPDSPPGRAKWQSGRINASTLSVAELNLRGVVSGPMGLCQAAVDLWAELGRKADDLAVLDELPPPGTASVSPETPVAAKVAANIVEESPLPQQETMQPQATASVTKAKLPSPRGPFGFNIFCSIFEPFACRGRAIDKDDAEGPAVRASAG